MDGILVVESVAGDSIMLRKSLVTVEEMFGSNFTNSTMVILTKRERCQECGSRIHALEGICKSKGVKYMLWWNQTPDQNKHQFYKWI